MDIRTMKYRLEDKGCKLLGEGRFSDVFAPPTSPDRVIKLSHGDGDTQDGWIDYCVWGAKLGYAGNFVPKVYSYHRFKDGTYIAVVERLHSTADAVANLKAYDYFSAAGELLLWPKQPKPELEAAYPGITQFCLILSRKSGGFDTHGGNIMFRSNGTMCFNDPLSWSQWKGPIAPPRMREHELAVYHTT